MSNIISNNHMQSLPTKEWLAIYEQRKELLSSPSDLNGYFNLTEICGKSLFRVPIGNVNFPTGKVIVRDPLVYLSQDEKPYFTTVATGKFPIEILVVEVEKDHYRYVAFRVKISAEVAVRHLEALVGHENISELNEGEFYGFNVDAGLATILDIKTKDAYLAFEQAWYQANPDGNIYNDFFETEFKKNFENNPLYQRDAGDWINFAIPDTDLTIPMIQTGYGDGTYPVYFGYDNQGEVCEIVVQFIDLELTFGTEQNEER